MLGGQSEPQCQGLAYETGRESRHRKVSGSKDTKNVSVSLIPNSSVFLNLRGQILSWAPTGQNAVDSAGPKTPADSPGHRKSWSFFHLKQKQTIPHADS